MTTKTRIALGQPFRQLLVKDRLGQDLEIIISADKLNEVEQGWIEWFALTFPGSAFVAGLPRSGKTMLMGFEGFVGKKYFGIDSVCDTHLFRSPQDGGNALLYNSYKYMDDELLLVEENKMLKVSKDFRDKFNSDPDFRANAVNDLWAEYEKISKISLHGKVIHYDEVYQKMDVRRPHDPMNILYGQQLKQYGHYYSLFLMAAPKLDECDKRLGNNICLEISTWWEKYRIIKVEGVKYRVKVNVAHYHLYDRDNKIEANLHLEGRKWWPLIYSFQMVAPRKRMIGMEKEG